MRALVLGGNRYIGLHLVFELARQGHEVTVANSHEAPLPDGAQRIHVDRQEPGALADALAPHRDDFDIVYDNTSYRVADLEPVVDTFDGPRAATRVHQLGGGVQAQLDAAGPRGLAAPRARRSRTPARRTASARSTARTTSQALFEEAGSAGHVATGHAHHRSEHAAGDPRADLLQAARGGAADPASRPTGSRSCTSCTCRTSPG